MTMKSLDLIPHLTELPGQTEGDKWSNRDRLISLLESDRTLRAAEYSAAASAGMWALFDNVNVDDALRENLLEAYQAQYPGLDATHSLTEQWQEMIDRGPESMDGFMNGLKGKIAEFDARDQLQGQGGPTWRSPRTQRRPCGTSERFPLRELWNTGRSRTSE